MILSLSDGGSVKKYGYAVVRRRFRLAQARAATSYQFEFFSISAA
jgi:hypothetical protein